MRLQEIPCSERVTIADEAKTIREALASIHEAAAIPNLTKHFSSDSVMTFGASAPIEGAPCSGRILFTTQQKCGIKLPAPMTPHEMSEDLVRLAGEARYVVIPDRWEATRGWEIRAAVMQSQPVAIIWATWIRRQSTL